ncbi:sigma-54-dependent transcriptional regulator [Thioalbus denitrificans]|uniref:DNA-binding NtrC family response regulator n=1 Tax=Thioalbus denitrificans TaxID=547122 RepID=A0A369CHH2_9GAMM|nr:sigma-54 dependent transcriptional regulator [Thioalbus denitrificans]RCX31917.1 DNA-binding NtrC family response regulator [Thioalbus denitrificans]
MSETLLVIEDETLVGSELQRHYRRGGWEVVLARSLAEARRSLVDQQLEPLVVISDMSLPDGNALDLLESLAPARGGGEWIFLTGYGSVPDSVRALRLGAYDFLEKPCDLERLDVVVAGAGRSARAQRRLRDEAAARSRRYAPASFAGRSPAAQSVRKMLERLTRVPFSALVITGETGTGKGLAARILHHAGTRADGPLVEVNCAALPHELLESELFGHEPGAFTGAKGRRRGLMEQASGGTLFLDEIAELDPELQAKLLRAVEDQRIRRLGGDREISVDLQILAATNRDLETMVAEGDFRNDLYHRLSVFRLELPPLRSRKADLEDLVPLFVAEFNAKSGRRVRNFPDPLWERLRAHDWPGNVRELRNVVERCVLFSDGEEFPLEWLQLGSPAGAVAALPAGAGSEGVFLPLDGSMAIEDMDRHIIRTALEKHDFNVSATARALGTTRETLRYRVQKYHLLPDSD